MLDPQMTPLQAKYLPNMNLVAIMVDHGKGWESICTFTPEQALDFGPKLAKLAKVAIGYKNEQNSAAETDAQPTH